MAPVNSLHFWVINTCDDAGDVPVYPVNSLHFWVINTPRGVV